LEDNLIAGLNVLRDALNNPNSGFPIYVGQLSESVVDIIPALTTLILSLRRNTPFLLKTLKLRFTFLQLSLQVRSLLCLPRPLRLEVSDVLYFERFISARELYLSIVARKFND
jgi:hypothetical protein